MKVTYYVASSIDGYIAKDDGDVSWLDELNISMESSGYEEFFATVDALVMGRKTYEIISNFGSWPYGNKPSWICSKNKINVIEGINLQKSTSPEDVINEAQKMSITHLWLVGGGILATYFINHSLLTNISVAQMPIILGEGIHLFGPSKQSNIIQLISCKRHELGFAQLEYVIINA